MSNKQDRPLPYVLASKPLTSYSSISSVASATSAATSRSGGSKLLFGEIDTSSDRSSGNYASVRDFVLSDSSTFLKFWLEDRCRDTFLSFVPRKDLANLRRACHDFSVRAAPALFSDLSITFKTNTFTKPSKLAALDRVGFFVKKLSFNLPHSGDTFLPPLVDPESGEELNFTYTPQFNEPSSPRRPKYGDLATTEILTRQYPPLFHAATNVPAFIRAFSALINLEHLSISTPNYNTAQRYRRTVVDYALISLRIAIERSCLNALESLTVSPIHPGGLMYLSPILGLGASPKSASRWSRIRKLSIHAHALTADETYGEPDQVKFLQVYLRNFQTNLENFSFHWIGSKGPLPVKQPAMSVAPLFGEHPANTQATANKVRLERLKPLHFPKLKCFEVENISTPSSDISAFVASHRKTIEELTLGDVRLTQGTWEEALSPLTRRHRRVPRLPPREMAEIPIMLSPTAVAAPIFPSPMERLEFAHHDEGRKSLRVSRWMPKTQAALKVVEGLVGCEQHLKRVFRGSAFPWR